MKNSLLLFLAVSSITVVRPLTAGANPTVPPGQPGYVLFSNATDTILVSGNTVVTDSMTIEAEVLFPSALSSNQLQSYGVIYEEQRDANEDKQLGVSSEKIYGLAWTTNYAGIDDSGIASTQSLTLDVWHHVAVVRDQNQQRLYLDGTLTATRNLTGTHYDLPIGNFPGSPRTIGAFVDPLRNLLRPGFQGEMEWVRVSDTARYSGANASPPPSVPSSDSDTLLLFDFRNVAPGSTKVYDLSTRAYVGTSGAGFAKATAPVFVPAGVPVISDQPKSLTVKAGQSAALSVSAGGLPPLSYQWYAGTSPDTSSLVAGATNTTFMTPPLFGSTPFWVAVVDYSGMTASGTALVTVVPDTAATLSLQWSMGLSFLTINGTVGRPCHIQYATDLGTSNWAPLLTVTLPSSPYTFTDSVATNAARFYRAVTP
jgi:hypothetical protein